MVILLKNIHLMNVGKIRRNKMFKNKKELEKEIKELKSKLELEEDINLRRGKKGRNRNGSIGSKYTV